MEGEEGEWFDCHLRFCVEVLSYDSGLVPYIAELPAQKNMENSAGCSSEFAFQSRCEIL